MATLDHIIASGELVPYEPDLEAAEQPHRYLYAVPEFVHWFTQILPGLPRDRGRNLSPQEQVDDCLHGFVTGRPLAYGVHWRQLEPHAEGVWELKTTDVRIFGWFVRKSTFVMVEGVMRKDLRNFKDYSPIIGRVAARRAGLSLDAPKSVAGGARDVL